MKTIPVVVCIVPFLLDGCASNKSTNSSYDALLEFTVSAEGKPLEVKVLESRLSSEQQEKLIGIAKKFVFHPAMKDGVPIEAKQIVPIAMDNVQ